MFTKQKKIRRTYMFLSFWVLITSKGSVTCKYTVPYRDQPNWIMCTALSCQRS